MRHVTNIRVTRMWETCERTTYYVQLTTDEGFTMTPAGFATGSLYNDFQGLTKDEARDRALSEAYEWADFLDLPIEPYEEDGVKYEPSFVLHTYTTRRQLAKRREKEERAK